MKLLYIISFLAVLVATILYMFFPQVAPFVFSVGVVGIIVFRLRTLYAGSDFRVKRLYIMQNLATLLYIAVAYFMFIQSDIWVFILLVAALVETMVVLRMPNKRE
ncbi:MAG: hypothetical protein KBD91_07480 [Paludibacteraceae bacterium]|jgi:hypothetical protein|nr:hypothetical protein [Paludibacteraceae bacterium]MBP8628087.1 hypothetical protein [Paludibacteraceae bacterium]MBP9649082.1 hypothetical protein [Paludibacteraceae bacterium]MBP9970595.1 hypothetical protein [Paludibacteraceae bacterium]HOR41463.1 hypothetical protein [Paludibacteraceae bacterium]